LIGAHQNASAALRGIAHELKLELLGPVEVARLDVARTPNRLAAPD